MGAKTGSCNGPTAAITTAAYTSSDWTLTLGVSGALAIVGGGAWLVLEHRRVLRIESFWNERNSS